METLDDATLRRLSDLMHASVGLSFNASKLPLVSGRLRPRLERLGLTRYQDYLALLERPDEEGEFQMAVDLLTTNETYFFRETAHFELLSQFMREHRGDGPKIWSAACSFGDEVYSIAMVLTELMRRSQLGGHWQVLGTDISDRALRGALQAVYPSTRWREVPPELRRRYAIAPPDGRPDLLQVHPMVRERCRFGQLNLCQEMEALGPFDVVFLRNVLIYFDPPLKRAVSDRVIAQLRPGGLLFTGIAEGRVACSTPMQHLAPGVSRKPL